MDVSIIIPVHDEEDVLTALFSELAPALQELPQRTEIVFVDDGSRDGSLGVLERIQSLAAGGPAVRIVELDGNFGQHPAIIAGFSVARGRVLVTFDADLQSDPRDIPRLVRKLEEGHDFVGGVRLGRSDPFWLRRLPSLLLTRVLNMATGKRLRDHNCSLNALRREIAEAMRGYGEMQRFLKPLAVRLSSRTAEVEVAHRPRRAGRSKYGTMALIDLFFDFLTNFSTHLFQRVALAGGVIAGLSLLTGAAYLLLRFPFGLLTEGLDRLQVLVLTGFLSGMQLLVLGVLGDFVTRIYRRMEPRPLYRIRKVTEPARTD